MIRWLVTLAVIASGTLSSPAAESALVELVAPKTDSPWLGQRLDFAVEVAVEGRFGGATVCAPIEPLQAAYRLMHVRNFIYHQFLLRRMKRDVLDPNAGLDVNEAVAVRRSSSVYEFDDVFTAPRNGFDGVEDYYRRTAGAAHAHQVEVPLLMIHAVNDPWIPAAPYQRLAESPPRNVELVLVPSGGHVGFHAADSNETWHDRRIEQFVSSIP